MVSQVSSFQSSATRSFLPSVVPSCRRAVVRSIVRSVVPSFVPSAVVPSFVPSFLPSFLPSFVPFVFVPSFTRLFLPSFTRLSPLCLFFLHLFLPSLVPSFTRSFLLCVGEVCFRVLCVVCFSFSAVCCVVSARVDVEKGKQRKTDADIFARKAKRTRQHTVVEISKVMARSTLECVD